MMVQPNNCAHLATLLQGIATCWMWLTRVSNLSQQYPICCNTLKEADQMYTT